MVPTTILIVATLGLTASDFSPESTLRLAARDAHGSSSLHFASAFSAAASRAPADDEETVLDISKARRLLGFEPQHRLEDSLGEFVDWVRGETVVDRNAEMRRQLEERRLVS